MLLMPFKDTSHRNSRLRIKFSYTPGEEAQPGSLAPGELALQGADGRLMYTDSEGSIQGFPAAVGVNKIVALTQAEYDALTPPDANTLYVIT